MSVKIISDSACDIQQDEAKKLDVTIMPFRTFIDGEEFLDGITITPEEFYEKLETCKELPKTSQLTPADFDKVLTPIVENDDEAVIISIPEVFSGTIQNARLMAQEKGKNIYVVDSGNATIGQQILVRYAAQLRDKGLSAKEIAEELERAKKRIHLVASVDTLEYLQRGGRVSKTVAVAGNLLKIKPVLDVNMTDVDIVAKPRGHKKSREKVQEFIDKAGGIDFDLPVIYGFSGVDDTLLKEFMNATEDVWKDHEDDLIITNIGSTMSTHTGPGCYGVAFFAKEDDK